ncbi:hypothetical protein [Hymenobacter volaticus]|uniref:Uncharacterized protein n=1 Tax=Hymenobacter volaticus TaxID=2932254 RepID=A0ABY4GC55_9BACT|nr:hypothetical protein [Hymenobacter volaticus]UOQ68418.1 hypothetical protein MUN86_11555 [Hymenobacter volaticus]
MSTQPNSSTNDDSRADNRHRPPERTSYRTTTEPLIVTPTFLTRADATPRTLRPSTKVLPAAARARRWKTRTPSQLKLRWKLI